MRQAKKKEVEKEKEKEARRSKEMKDILRQLQQVSQKEKDLQRSLESSRSSTLVGSPSRERRKRKCDSKNKPDKRIVMEEPRWKSKVKGTTAASRETKSEYDETLQSFLKLKQGNSQEYADLVMQAMSATDNIMAFKNMREPKNSEKSRKVKQSKETKTQVQNEHDNSDNHIIDLIEKLRISNHSKLADTETTKGEKALLLQAQLVLELSKKNKGNTKMSLNDSYDRMTQEAGENCNDEYRMKTKQKNQRSEDDDKKKKMQSGKSAKPREVDILNPVKFPHERLDPRHAHEAEFSTLPFNWLIAGELELIAR